MMHRHDGIDDLANGPRTLQHVHSSLRTVRFTEVAESKKSRKSLAWQESHIACSLDGEAIERSEHAVGYIGIKPVKIVRRFLTPADQPLHARRSFRLTSSWASVFPSRTCWRCFALRFGLGFVVPGRVPQSREERIAARVQGLQHSLSRPDIFQTELIDQPVKGISICCGAYG